MSVGVTPIKYERKVGFPNGGIAADVAGRELDRLAKRDQEVVPITLVEESRTPDAPLHSYFEWNDEIAGGLHREDQAKRLIRSIQVTYVRNDTEEPLPPVRAYVSVVDESDFEMYAPSRPGIGAQRHYRPMVKVMSDVDLREQYKRQAFDALVTWRQRYRDIEAFAHIFEQVDKLVAQIKT
jgi:hypothetical protein